MILEIKNYETRDITITNYLLNKKTIDTHHQFQDPIQSYNNFHSIPIITKERKSKPSFVYRKAQ